MFSSASIAKVIEDGDLEPLMTTHMLLGDLDLPEEFKDELMRDKEDDNDFDVLSSISTTIDDVNKIKKKIPQYKPREYIPRTPKEESHWWRRYLSRRHSIIAD